MSSTSPGDRALTMDGSRQAMTEYRPSNEDKINRDDDSKAEKKDDDDDDDDSSDKEARTKRMRNRERHAVYYDPAEIRFGKNEMMSLSKDIMATLPQRSGLAVETVSLTAKEGEEDKVEWGAAKYAVAETEPDRRPRLVRVDRFQLTCLVSIRNGIKSDFRCTNFQNVLQKVVM